MLYSVWLFHFKGTQSAKTHPCLVRSVAWRLGFTKLKFKNYSKSEVMCGSNTSPYPLVVGSCKFKRLTSVIKILNVPTKSGAMNPSENLPLGSSLDFPYGQKPCGTFALVRFCLFPASKFKSPNVNKATAGILCPATVIGLWNSVSTKNSPRTVAKLPFPAIV